MAYTTINKHTDYFNTKLYTGNGSTQSITGVGFQPDWTWIKRRDGGTSHHQLFDAVRGATKRIYTSSTAAEDTATDTLTAFDSDGFSVGANGGVNGSSNATVAWNWKANGSGSANTDGGINSTVSVNNTAGFSIVKYGTGTGSATTVGHGLNAAPNLIIVKPLGTVTTGGWIMGADAIDTTWNTVFTLNETAAAANDPSFNDTAPTSSVFSVGNNNTNRSGENYIAYCFVEKKGYSKFGSYTGNGNVDGAFVYTGFAPSFVMIKRTNSATDWMMFDNKRTDGNPNLVNKYLLANDNGIEGSNSTTGVDFLSNGFKCRNTFASVNTLPDPYFYMAFGQSLVGSNNVPCTAR